MSRVNVYLPDELADRAKRAGLNVSSLTQDAIQSALAAESIDSWLHKVSELPTTGVKHEDVLSAVDLAKREVEGDDRIAHR